MLRTCQPAPSSTPAAVQWWRHTAASGGQRENDSRSLFHLGSLGSSSGHPRGMAVGLVQVPALTPVRRYLPQISSFEKRTVRVSVTRASVPGRGVSECATATQSPTESELIARNRTPGSVMVVLLGGSQVDKLATRAIIAPRSETFSLFLSFDPTNFAS